MNAEPPAEQDALEEGAAALVREADVVALLARLRAEITPKALAARRERAERRAIRERAEREAAEIITWAQEEVERLVHDTHLLRDTRGRVDEMVEEARAKAEMVRAGADAFLAARLHGFAEQLGDLRTVMDRDVKAIQDGLVTLRERLAGEGAGERVPLRPEDALLPPEPSIRHEFRVPAEETAPHPEPRSGPNSPTPNSPLS